MAKKIQILGFILIIVGAILISLSMTMDGTTATLSALVLQAW